MFVTASVSIAKPRFMQIMPKRFGFLIYVYLYRLNTYVCMHVCVLVTLGRTWMSGRIVVVYMY